MSILDFCPTETPEQVPVLTHFEVHGKVYVVDLHGMLFQIVTTSEDPELWTWYPVLNL